MSIDEQGRKLLSRFQPAQKSAFFACLIMGYLVHLYAFTNLIPNSDGLSRVFDLQQMTVSGRWFLHYASALNRFTQMPAAIGLVSLVLLAMAAVLVVDLLGIQSRWLGGLCGGVMAVFPCLGYTFLYMFTASAYCLAIFMAVLSVWMVRWGWKGWLCGVLLLAMTMGTYQAYATVAISLSVLVVLRHVLLKKAAFQSTMRLGLCFVSFLAAGAAAYYGILMAVLKFKNLELLSYLGMDAASSGYPLKELPRLILDTYKQVIAFFFLPGSANGFSDKMMVVCNGALILLAAYFVCRRMSGKKLWGDTWRIFGILALVAIFPLAVNFSQIISPYSVPTPLMKYAYVTVYLAVLMVADLADAATEEKFTAPVLGAVVLMVLMVNFANTNNLLYTASAQAQESTRSYLTRLLTRIEDCDGYEPGMEVVVIGAIPEEQLHSDVESYAQVDHYSVPMHTVASLNKHIYYYFNDWLNTPIAEPEEETMICVAQTVEFEQMPLYPKQGSVQVLDGRVVVKLRENYTPKSEFELAYENRR